jgi:hypothetical protein
MMMMIMVVMMMMMMMMIRPQNQIIKMAHKRVQMFRQVLHVA